MRQLHVLFGCTSVVWFLVFAVLLYITERRHELDLQRLQSRIDANLSAVLELAQFRGRLLDEPKSTQSALRGFVHTSHAGVSSEYLKVPSRRLMKISIDDYTAATSSTACVTLSLATSSITMDLSTNACNGHRCPPCVIISTAHPSNQLLIEKCSTAKITDSVTMGSGTGVYSKALSELTIINADTAKSAKVGDGTQVFTLVAKSQVVAFCWSGGSNALYFPSLNYQRLGAIGQLMASAACAGLQTSSALVRAIARDCSSGVSCTAICSTYGTTQTPQTPSCFNALHLYPPGFTNEVHEEGLMTYVYQDCTNAGCGPNYCCCQGNFR